MEKNLRISLYDEKGRKATGAICLYDDWKKKNSCKAAAERKLQCEIPPPLVKNSSAGEGTTIREDGSLF